MQQTFDEANRDLIGNVASRLVHRDQAGVSPFDSVVQGGDAVGRGCGCTTAGVHIRLTLTRGVKVTSGMDPRLNQSGPTLIVEAPSCSTS